MAWYDLFAKIYDQSLEGIYADARSTCARALASSREHVVLDLPCGTGASFAGLGAEGATLLGGDLSAGMLRLAAQRAASMANVGIQIAELNVMQLSPETLAEAFPGHSQVDRIHVFLGMTVFPHPDEAMERLWSVLRPGGQLLMADVYAEKLGFHGRMVNLVARAEIRRRAWEPLEARAESFERVELPPDARYGGTLYYALGKKAAIG